MYTVIDMKLFCRILFVMLFFPLAASAADTYLKLMQTGTAKQIKRAFLFDADAPFHTIGKERNNLLITAIIYDRSEDVIRLLLKADIGADQKNREKRTAVSYACEYCTGKSRFDLILASGGASPKKIRSRLMSRDKSGRYAASYAEKNSESEIRNSIASYLTQSDIALIEQTTEGGVPLLAAAVNAYRPTGESSKAVKRKTEKTKKREVKQTENDDLSPDAETTAVVSASGDRSSFSVCFTSRFFVFSVFRFTAFELSPVGRYAFTAAARSGTPPSVVCSMSAISLCVKYDAIELRISLSLFFSAYDAA